MAAPVPGKPREFHDIRPKTRIAIRSPAMTGPQSHPASWHDIVLASLKANDVRLTVYVPDRVLTPLIAALHRDPFFTCFACTREEEALGIVSGAWMGGMRGAVLMQTSGFATIPNALASLVAPSQIPALLFVSERGTLGEFNLGQAMVLKTMRPVLDALAIDHYTITRQDELAFILDRAIKQAVAIQAPAAFILSPLLTGGKVFQA
jgi:sulfopyruvate decarboxylase TPP-binding subunit